MDDKSFNIRVPKRWARIAMIVGMTALIVAPLTAIASHNFTDVPDSNTFHEDIAWLADADVTRGCNPSEGNTEFCPNDFTTRGQMAAFMRRFAQYIDAEDGTPALADHATTADNATTADSAVEADVANSVAPGVVGSDELEDDEPYRIVGTPGEPAFQNGWDNWGNDFSEAGFYKDLHGVVHLKGTVSGGTNDAAAFTLPEGYRPSENLFLPLAGGGPVAANLQIFTDGSVEPTCAGGACISGMDGLSFRVGDGAGAASTPGASINE